MFRAVSSSATSTLSLASDNKTFLGGNISSSLVSSLVKGDDDGAQPSALFKLARVRTATWATAGGTFTKGGDFFCLQTLHAGRNMHIRMSGVFRRNFEKEQKI